MPVIDFSTSINAPPEICFDMARDIDLHVKSTPGTDERAVGGITSGLMGLGQEVTWEATHFGLTRTTHSLCAFAFAERLTSRITVFDRPYHFRDSLVSGAFSRFDHDHYFLLEGRGTVMRDVFDYGSPFGWFGRFADILFLRSYMARLLTRRARIIKLAAEATATWR
jgi:ligand-binding SRPBCC domain-containing protein